MSRTADSSLSNRILDAAYELLHAKGIEAVTLREVAAQAKTSTPTVYARFKTKEHLLMSVADRIRKEFVADITQQPTLLKAAKRYLELAINRPEDYRLMFEVGWPAMFTPQFGIVWSRERFAELYGGKPEDYAQVVDCLWMELHGGAAFVLLAPNQTIAADLFDSCMRSCALIIENARLFVPSKKRRLNG